MRAIHTRHRPDRREIPEVIQAALWVPLGRVASHAETALRVTKTKLRIPPTEDFQLGPNHLIRRFTPMPPLLPIASHILPQQLLGYDHPVHNRCREEMPKWSLLTGLPRQGFPR